MQGFIDKGYLAAFDDLASCERYLGAKPVLSKIGCITRQRMGKIKRRLIVDSKRSGVSRAAGLGFRSVLPRMLDLVFESLEMMADLPADEDIEFLVLDFIDAFWLLPLSPKERRYFVAMLRGRYLVWCRTAQGSRGAPLSWAVFAALLMRCAQGVAGKVEANRRVRNRAAGHCYVDNPILAVRGSPAQRARTVVRVALAWMVLGLPLAFHKGRLSSAVVWIGFQATKFRDRVDIEIPADKVAEMLVLTREVASKNVVGERALRSFAGKCVNFASVVHMWRPFLEELWAALRCGKGDNPTPLLLPHGQDASSSQRSCSAPKGCIWVIQIMPALLWIYAFLSGIDGSIKRSFTLNVYMRLGDKVDIYTDASPWGIGGWIAIGGSPRAYFAQELLASDVKFFRQEIGSCEGQQTWEALAILVALRVWKSLWQHVRARLSIRADNMSALAMVAYFKARGTGVARIAREIALEIADAEFGPDIVAHLPGVANGAADVLSRRFQPGAAFRLPPLLAGAEEVVPPARSFAWYRSLNPPSKW